jgi:glycosyltransferase EpsE
MENRKSPLISVLMGVYNCASTVEEAVQSIIDQTITDWELIICDDGSADNTYEVVKALAEKEKRIVLIRNEGNMGLAPTLNNCLRIARGTYTARMDGDDICAPDRFEKELAVLEADPDCAVVSCGMLSFDEAGVYGQSDYPEKPDKTDFFRMSPFCHAGCMMRREILQELGGYRESDDVQRFEDYDLWYRLYKAGYYGRNLPEPLYSMRDDRNAFRRRKLKYRVNVTKLTWKIYRDFKPGVRYLPTIPMPIIKGLIPEFLYTYLRRRKLRRQIRVD